MLDQGTNNLEDLPCGLEALLFVIYGAAVHSMDDDACTMRLGEARNTLQRRYRYAARKALARARFVSTSELIVLQAFTLHLLTMREFHDSRTTWIFAGVAARIAQVIGIHVDGTDLGLSPFETEMRRRLWWQIAILESRSAELTGSRRSSNIELSNVQLPTNVEDADIWPEMSTAVTARVKPTESIACLIRYELVAFWDARSAGLSSLVADHISISLPSAAALKQSDSMIDELEQLLEGKYLRYCDPATPIQLLAIIIARSAINVYRLKAHHPRRYPRNTVVPDKERELLWRLCIKLLEHDNLAHSSRQIRRFMWHSKVYFQWQAIIYLLGELRNHTLGPKVEYAWQQIEDVFYHHPNFITDWKKPLHVAVGRLCLKAFRAREAALRDLPNRSHSMATPKFITQLRAQPGNGSLPGSRRTPPVPTTTSAPLELLPTLVQPRTVSNRNEIRARLSTPSNLTPHQTSTAIRPDETDENCLLDWTFADDLGMTDLPIDWALWDSMIEDSNVQQA
ncbi:hypothetical protein LTR84_010059 [Exophiala bonariae]|uniref:Xylanolytic transcriptional activator regulatory domain-containing protein n=1 Tax=Exophiala bonariae TaxID=1690606 RepID=A0AAV9NMP5_9EURO|nr:hypothetical protein LTR84_010059 [Exophiala bonariae]